MQGNGRQQQHGECRGFQSLIEVNASAAIEAYLNSHDAFQSLIEVNARKTLLNENT